jgi:hypothetical protein
VNADVTCSPSSELIEGAPPGYGMKFISTLVARLSRAWSQAMLNKDEQITVHGYRAKSEPFVMTARTTDLPGGKEAILSAQMMKSPDLIVAERLQKQRRAAMPRCVLL